MQDSGKHAPITTFLKHVAGIKLKLSTFFKQFVFSFSVNIGNSQLSTNDMKILKFCL